MWTCYQSPLVLWGSQILREGKTLQGACCCRQQHIEKLWIWVIITCSGDKLTKGQAQSKRVRNVCLPRASSHLLFSVLKWWAVSSGLEQYFNQVVQKRRRRRKSQQSFPHCLIAKHFHSWVPTAEYRHQVSLVLKLKWLWNKVEPVADFIHMGSWWPLRDLLRSFPSCSSCTFPLASLKAPPSLGLVPSYPGDPKTFWYDSLVTSDR